jgi:hypothetical protein
LKDGSAHSGYLKPYLSATSALILLADPFSAAVAHERVEDVD